MSDTVLQDMDDDDFARACDRALLLGRSDCHDVRVALAPGPRFRCMTCLDDCAVMIGGEEYLSRYGGGRERVNVASSDLTIGVGADAQAWITRLGELVAAPHTERERVELKILRERCARQRELIRALRLEVREVKDMNSRILTSQVRLVEQLEKLIREKA